MQQLTKSQILELRTDAIENYIKNTCTNNAGIICIDNNDMRIMAKATIEADEKAGVLMLVEDEGLGIARELLPDDLSKAESKELLEKAENLWQALEQNNLGGFSGINRPFFILSEFKEVIEKFGSRDVGLKWSYNRRKEAREYIQRANTPCYTCKREESNG